MKKLIAVEQAKTLMSEAREWPVWRWLLEKGRVRAAADLANEALAEQERKVKAAWPEGFKDRDPQYKDAIERVQKADKAAETARLDAEGTFDEAERRLSTSLAREGTEKAIHSWELREKAIRAAEAVARNARVPAP